MSTQLETILLSHPVNEWQVRQVIVLDWYDGPRMGLCEMAHPQCCFQFELLAERHSEDDLDDRLFRLNEASSNIMAQMLLILTELGQPNDLVWVPIWKFSTEVSRLEAENKLENLFSNLKSTNLIVQTQDMIHFSNCWLSV